LRVAAVQVAITLGQGRAWVWVEGDRLDDAGIAVGRVEALVEVPAEAGFTGRVGR
jgi:hypothetical protein